MKRIFYRIIVIVCAIVFINCNVNNRMVAQNIIKEGSIQKFDRYSFIIKFSNLIYEIGSKRIAIPIFQGNMGDVTYDTFLNYCYNNNLLNKEYQEGDFVIVAKKGELKKTFHDFLRFYKNNILQDVNINKPAKMRVIDGVLDVFYEFNVQGIPMVLQVTIYTTEEFDLVDLNKIDSVFTIDSIDENMKTPKPYFMFNIWQNQTSRKL